MAIPFLKKKEAKKPQQEESEKKIQSSLALPDERIQEHEEGAHESGKKHSVFEHAIILRPLMTEKSFHLTSAGKYVFEVAPHANKLSVKKAFFNVYGVMPTKVAVMHVGGKQVRFGRQTGNRKNWKKVIVTVKKGHRGILS